MLKVLSYLRKNEKLVAILVLRPEKTSTIKIERGIGASFEKGIK